mgnify:CR=1 FL=1
MTPTRFSLLASNPTNAANWKSIRNSVAGNAICQNIRWEIKRVSPCENVVTPGSKDPVTAPTENDNDNKISR